MPIAKEAMAKILSSREAREKRFVRVFNEVKRGSRGMREIGIGEFCHESGPNASGSSVLGAPNYQHLSIPMGFSCWKVRKGRI
jgi:hypothetical protein